jgi:hypothetical protein
MKKFIVLTGLLFLVFTVYSQETFFPTKEGTILTYKSFDKKSKESGSVRYTINKVNVKGSDIDITYLCESLDPKESIVYKEEITIHQKGDKLYMDMSNFVNKAGFQQNGEIPAGLEITGNSMEIPVNAQPGTALPDASVQMALKMGFINMKMAADITNRKVEAVEDLTISAGTFKCLKFSSDVNATVMGMNVKSKSLEWYSKGTGLVKSESYDKNGKLQSYTELVNIKK